MRGQAEKVTTTPYNLKKKRVSMLVSDVAIEDFVINVSTMTPRDCH